MIPKRVWALITATITGAASVACGQTMSMSMGIADPAAVFAPRYTSQDFARLVDVLQLHDGELAAAKDLHDGYVKLLEHRQAELIEQQLKTVDRGTMLQDMSQATSATQQSDLTKAWKEEAAKAERSFLSDLKALIAEKDLSRWEMVERERRRIRERKKGTMLAESVDIVRVVITAIPQRVTMPAVRELLDAYTIEIDRLYVARIRAAEEFAKVNRAEAFDAKGVERAWNDLHRVRVQIRELNESFARRVSSVLATQDAEAFDREFFAAAYPRLMAPSATGKIMSAAQSLRGLHKDKRRLCEEHRRVYDDAVLALARRSVAAEKEREVGFTPRLGAIAGQTSGDDLKRFVVDPTSAVGKLRSERAVLDANARGKLLAILSPDERAELLAGMRLNIVVDNRDEPAAWFPTEEDE